MESRDLKTQDQVSTLVRRWNRRTLLRRGATGIAGLIASAAIGHINGAERAFAAPNCSPPAGRYCGGCGYYGECPSGYVTCTTSNRPCGSGDPCIYSSGYWYTDDGYLCRDCRVYTGPISCGPEYYGLCGCKSQHKYW